MIKRICVFCGSCPGDDPAFGRVAAEMGAALAARNVGVVYGGGRVGLMGALARSALESGGEVVGVIPQSLVDLELAFNDITTMHVVNSMHERKALMADLSDAFIAMPGGFGTLDEFFEAVTWLQLGFHDKPCGLLNVGGFFDPLLAFLDVATDRGFIHPVHRAMIICETNPVALLNRIAAFIPPAVDKAAWATDMTKR